MGSYRSLPLVIDQEYERGWQDLPIQGPSCPRAKVCSSHHYSMQIPRRGRAYHPSQKRVMATRVKTYTKEVDVVLLSDEASLCLREIVHLCNCTRYKL